MKHQIEYTVSQFKGICGFKVTLICAHHLWGVNYQAGFFDGVKADSFLLLTAKLIYITNSIGSDIEPAVAFLTKMVAKSNVDYWKKLRK